VTGARPGVRIPSRRASGQEDFTIVADTRERYAYKFTGQQAVVAREPLPVGDYGVLIDAAPFAVVERKSVADLTKSLVDGSLGFLAAEVAELPHADPLSQRPRLLRHPEARRGVDLPVSRSGTGRGGR